MIQYFVFLMIITFVLYSLKKYNYKKRENYTTKGNINDCYSNVMSEKEEKILYQLIEIWNKISEELDIKWSVCAGTYIGLKRHKGRIPWDDDFDVTVMKKDAPKFKNMGKILSKYNVSLGKFWGGYKIFFNDHRAVKKFKKYGWNWPFIDIFALGGKTPECGFLKKNEFPLKKVNFGNTHVYMYENPSRTRKCIRNTIWKKELLDTGYRHQTERNIKKK